MNGLLHAPDGSLWATGGASLRTDFELGSHRAPVAVSCRLGGVAPDHYALLDTGATWTIVPSDLLEAVQAPIEPTGNEITIGSRFGRHRGPVVRMDLTLLAEPGWGVDLEIPGARALVIDDWPGPVVVGFHGALELIRFAMDPGVRPGEGALYFGLVGD